ncbi:MAG: MBL fold metallo-hydrolase [Opitutales bacterium]|nr:MBL fold metallo-hydrolase [Opitutales bacterium]NRA27313.1 MBL fold metallo-hydrolase [Opitutales bacterium]
MTAIIPLEDNYDDVMKKAMIGKTITVSMLAKVSGIDEDRVRALTRGHKDKESLIACAPHINLSTRALEALSFDPKVPRISPPKGLYMINTPFGEEMTVNAWIIADSAGNAAIFDTGTDAQPIFDCISKNQLKPRALFLTHGHRDHVARATEICEQFDIESNIAEQSSFSATRRFAYGDRFQIGTLGIETRKTTGHANDGTSFIISGLETPIAVVGDALFACSMGGGIVSYQEALDTNRAQLFTLPDDTIVAPGHGPLTDIAHERLWNPFFADNLNKATH